ncbi:NYN domain-containing protein [Actinocorallia longicatena]|uniref:NYN domain-containing protein n=1 Tax=Actinocorallia longicatena TaxID=111803 RepID=A0ABP6QAN0_9ACTN
MRLIVVEAAAEVLGNLPADEIPVPLRQIARFRPQSRAKQGAVPIAGQLETNAAFRDKVARPLRDGQPELCAALEAGEVPAAADPVRLAALAYLLRPRGWTEHVETARAELERVAGAAQEAETARTVAALRDQLAEARTARSEELERMRSELKEARTEIADLRRRLHDEKRTAKAARERAENVEKRHNTDRAETLTALGAADKELKGLRAKLGQAEAALESNRKAAREGRKLEDIRLRLLLDTLVEAAQGVRSELNLPAVILRPADLAGGVDPSAAPAAGRSLSENDPQLFNQVLALPHVHLIVDGYNVTKTGYGELPLADQRNRLISGLGGLAAQTHAEITCVFDGASLDGHIAVQAPRGVRVLFSRPGQIADDLIGELLKVEPPGRAVVVVSSDQEVAASARRAGGRPATASLLLKRLGRF